MARFKKGSQKVVSDEYVLSYDFKRQVPFWNYLMASYTLPESYAPAVVVPELDKFLENLLTGGIDSANGDALDWDFKNRARETLIDLSRQRTTHVDQIANFDFEAQGANYSFTEQLDLLKPEKDKVDSDIEAIEKMLDKITGEVKIENMKEAKNETD